MPQDLTAKQTGFVARYAGKVAELLSVVDALISLDAEFADNAYGEGGANEIPDAIVQSVLPASTAALFGDGEASVVTVLQTVESVRSALEWMRT